MTIPTGGFRLHWDQPGEDHGTLHLFQNVPNLDEALELAGDLYQTGVTSFTRLQNWLGEDACPADQLLPIAKMRASYSHLDRRKDEQQATLEATPGYATW